MSWFFFSVFGSVSLFSNFYRTFLLARPYGRKGTLIVHLILFFLIFCVVQLGLSYVNARAHVSRHRNVQRRCPVCRNSIILLNLFLLNWSCLFALVFMEDGNGASDPPEHSDCRRPWTLHCIATLVWAWQKLRWCCP